MQVDPIHMGVDGSFLFDYKGEWTPFFFLRRLEASSSRIVITLMFPHRACKCAAGFLLGVQGAAKTNKAGDFAPSEYNVRVSWWRCVRVLLPLHRSISALCICIYQNFAFICRCWLGTRPRSTPCLLAPRRSSQRPSPPTSRR